MNKSIPIGSIGVITLDDDQRLYRVNSLSNGLLHLQSISGPISFKTALPWHFWVLVDSL
jgi:hypothetical protein